jgi:hypothetical protein
MTEYVRNMHETEEAIERGERGIQLDEVLMSVHLSAQGETDVLRGWQRVLIQ